MPWPWSVKVSLVVSQPPCELLFLHPPSLDSPYYFRYICQCLIDLASTSMPPTLFNAIATDSVENYDGTLRRHCAPRSFQPLSDEAAISTFEKYLEAKLGDTPCIDPTTYWKAFILRLQRCGSHLASPAATLSVFIDAIHGARRSHFCSSPREKGLRLYRHLLYLDQYYLNPHGHKPLHAWLTLPTLTAHMGLHLKYYSWQSTPRDKRTFTMTISHHIEVTQRVNAIEHYLQTSAITLTDLIIMAYRNSLDVLHEAAQDQAIASKMPKHHELAVLMGQMMDADTTPADHALMAYFTMPPLDQAAIRKAYSIDQTNHQEEQNWLEDYFVWLMQIAQMYRPDDMTHRKIDRRIHPHLAVGHVALCLEQLMNSGHLQEKRFKALLTEEQRQDLHQRSAPTPPRTERKSISPTPLAAHHDLHAAAEAASPPIDALRLDP